MTYRPPVSEILLAMQSAGKFGAPHYAELSLDDAQAIISEAGRFAAERIAPLNQVGDRLPASINDGHVTTPPGWRETYRDWCAAGWNGLAGPAEHGGQGLPMLMAVGCTELWNSASMAFALCPLLTAGAIEAVAAHARQDLKDFYLPKLVSGEWTGTMNLTEPQAGSDLSDLRCRAERLGDGTYSITGNKIFITYGEHDCASNIVHLVLARLADAPAGTRGISLFLVPKFLPDGTRNDLRCHSLEHKLGIRASPTCAMTYGDNGGAKGWLIGEENRGLNCMFTMMNNARLLVGVQGVALAERATQMSVAYARERRQGSVPERAGASPIIRHPDVKRMLLEMRAKTAAARLLCMATACWIDGSLRAKSADDRRLAHARASLLMPLAKAYSTDIAVEVTSTAIQIHGGMGYIEETGVAQLYRDARILPIYEGTNGIQAIDLVSRKLRLDGGDTLSDALKSAQQGLAIVAGEPLASRIVSEILELAKTLSESPDSVQSLAAAMPLLRALAAVIAGGYLAESAALVQGGAPEGEARYFTTVELPTAMAAARSALSGAEILATYDLQ